MKSFIKEKWFAPVAVVLVAVVVILIMAMLGFRITYAPELENDWEAISAVASWVGVIASVFAILCAIQVPKTLADRQDKIALFEKRYNAYSSFLTVQNFSNAVSKETYNKNGSIMNTLAEVELCCFQFATVFGYHPQPSSTQLNIQSLYQTITLLNKHETEMEMLPFLFEWSDSEKDEIITDISNIFKPLYLFMNNIVSYTFEDDFEIDNADRQKFIDAVTCFAEKYAERFERELKI